MSLAELIARFPDAFSGAAWETHAAVAGLLVAFTLLLIFKPK